MKTVKKTVKMGKGEKAKVIPFTYERPERWDECEDAFRLAVADEQVSDTLSIVDVFNYGFELKIRAKIQGANTDDASKVKNRNLTMAWVMGGEGGEFKEDVLGLLTAGDAKALNRYLDELFTAEEGSITGK